MLDESNTFSSCFFPFRALLTRLAPCCLLLLFASFSCKDSPSASDSTKVTLTFEDASCIETWLQLKIENAAPPYSVALSRDGNTLSSLHILSSDTLLIDEGLSPSTTYTYRASLTLDNNIVVHSPDAPARTMDTTSHNWVFDPPVMLGDGSSSVLYDVAIINETLAYAVGEIYKQDSLGNWDPNAYNLVKWDGSSWELMRIQFYTFCGQPGTGSYPAKSIFAFGPTDIWIGMNGSQVVRWNGQSQSVPMCTPVSINKLWGENPSSVYAVGNGGGIARYDGTSWRRVESGTGLDVYDVYGSGGVVVAVAAKQFVNFDRRVLVLTPSRVDSVSSTGIPFSLNGVWFTSRSYYVVGAGMYTTSVLSPSTTWKAVTPQVTNYYLYTIRGQGLNDIVSAGGFGEFLHFNGVSWRSYRSQLSLPSGSYRSVSLRDNLCIAVGYDSPDAAVVVGRRTN